MTSLDTFLKNLNDSGLLSPTDVQTAAAQVPAAQRQDCRALADTLVHQRKLTKYQASMVLQGKTRGLVLDQYTIVDKLGQGGMAKVFKARPRRAPDRLVAIKVLPPSATGKTNALARFRREAKAAAQLRHPNIVASHGAGEYQGVHFLVMEFVDGIDLAQHIRQQGPLTVAQAAGCILQAARGLEHAHAAGIIHRDIKPGNLLVDRSGVVKVLDMGLARFEDTEAAEEPADQLTQDGTIIGTIDYMAPEQALNSKYADQRADIYGLGGTLYYLLAGKPMYDGETPMQRLMAHREQPIPELPGGDAALQAIFCRLVAKRPEDRYPSMTALVADLEAYRRTSGAPSSLRLAAALVKPALERIPPSARRWAALGAGLATLLVLVLFLSRLGGGGDASKTTTTTGTTSIVGKPPDDDVPAVIDLLALVDVKKDALRGRWVVQDGGLFAEGGSCFLELPYQPPEEYDFRIEFTRQGGATVDGVLTRGGRNLMFSMGWRELVGFQRIDGRNLHNGPPDAFRNYRIELNRRYTARVQVRQDGFRAYIDDELVSLANVGNQQISINQDVRDPHLLGLATHDNNRGVTFHKAEVVEVSGRGTFGRPNDPAAQTAAGKQKKKKGPAVPSVDDPTRWQRAINLMPLINLDQDVIAGKWSRDAEGISCENVGIPKLALPYLPPEEYDFRIEFVRTNGVNGVMQMLSKNGRSFAWEMGIFSRLMAFAAINGRPANNSNFSVQQALTNGQRYTAIVQVRNGGLKAYLNGKLISDLPTENKTLSPAPYWMWPDKLELGIGAFQSAATYYRIEVLEVTGRGSFTRPDSPEAMEADRKRGMP